MRTHPLQPQTRRLGAACKKAALVASVFPAAVAERSPHERTPLARLERMVFPSGLEASLCCTLNAEEIPRKRAGLPLGDPENLTPTVDRVEIEAMLLRRATCLQDALVLPICVACDKQRARTTRGHLRSRLPGLPATLPLAGAAGAALSLGVNLLLVLAVLLGEFVPLALLLRDLALEVAIGLPVVFVQELLAIMGRALLDPSATEGHNI